MAIELISLLYFIACLAGAYVAITSVLWTLGAIRSPAISEREQKLEQELEGCCAAILRLEKDEAIMSTYCIGLEDQVEQLEKDNAEIANDYQSLGNELSHEIDDLEERVEDKNKELVQAHADYQSLNSRHMDLVAKTEDKKDA